MYEDSVRLVIKGNDVHLERISTIMTTIDLSSNHFEGVIPKTLKDFGSLWLLNLSHNNLIRDIPMQLGQLNMLEALDLSWNRLTGMIPQELTSFLLDAFLEVHNWIHFLMTRMVATLIYVVLLYQSNVKQVIHHTFLSHWSRMKKMIHILRVDLHGKSVVIGYSCGLVVGTVMWSLVFKAHKPKWVVEFLEGVFPNKMRRPQKRRLRRRT
ncbi:hypothetical protein RND71_040686 [Anisodus tanguticus]|uniref:Uncharacterized protein n=1 Tax=Anisodus tanguticus TaxID=243964 RepID=A0AAE1QSP0_9SOLA|nr:hypothetical protein RND71_040686 [Anisodus tanguticus]